MRQVFARSASPLAFIPAVLLGAGAAHGQVIHQAAGANAAAIQAAVDSFRAELGTLNPNTPGSLGEGRREINWDGTPDAFSSPNALPADFFNGAAVGRARGVVFSTPGSGFEVSADADNPTTTPTEFANINATYSAQFSTFSPLRLFTAIGSTITDIHFFIPGSSTPAVVAGFGSVFTDVDLATSTRIDYFDAGGGLLASQLVPPSAAGSEGLSFAGAHFGETPRVGSVVIRSGSAALGAGVLENIAEGVDLAVMDDFLYGEPNLLLCPGDFNESGAVNSDDFFAFLDAFFAEDESADVNDDGVVSSDDFYTFLTDYFSACP